MKKVLSLLLVFALVLGMSVTSFAKTNNATTDDGFSVFNTSFGDASTYGGGGADIDLGDVIAYKGQTFSFYLATSAFTPSTEGTLTTAEKAAQTAYYAPKATAGLGKAFMKGVTSRWRVAKGSNVIDKAELSYAKPSGVNTDIARIEVKFVNPFPTANKDGTAFDFWVYPVVGGTIQPYDTKGVHIYGTLKNEVVAIDSAWDYVDLYTGIIADVTETIRNVKYSLGPDGSSNNNDDVVLVGRGVKGQKYWGRANSDISDTDADYMDKYDVTQVYHLTMLGGLDKVTDHVLLNTATKDDFVFDGELHYLGKGNDKLPVATTYYIAPAMIELPSDEEPVPEDEEAEDPLVTAPITGGDISAPAGIFDNPSTGA
jgi:hypothetical protein